MSLLLSDAHVVASLDPPRIERTDLIVDGERIAAVGLPIEVEPVPTRLDCSGCLIVPGNVCAHTHVYSALARGMPDRPPAPTSFLEILQRIWWRLDRALDPASIRASALVAGREAVLAGTTTLVDHHASPNAIDGSLDLVAEALAEIGVRSILCYEVTDRDGPDRAHAGLAENRRFLEATRSGTFPLARGMVGAHASFTLSPETLAACADLARSAEAGVHIHVAEDAVDEADAVHRYGRRVVQRLAGSGVLGESTLLAHAVHLDASEIELAAAAGVTFAHNPRSNMHNAVGRAPIGLLGRRVGLGTDGIGADLFEESRVAWLRRKEEAPTTPVDWPLARLAVGSGWAGRVFDERLLGRLEVGAPADLVVLDYRPPTPIEPSNLGGHWVFGLSAAAVRHVVVAGELVVRDRRLTRVDEEGLMASAAREATGLWRRMDEIGPHPFTPSVVLPVPIGAPSDG